MAIVLDKNYFKPLDEFFAKKTIQDVDRNTYLVCNLHDKPNNIHVSLIFLRDWDTLEADSFSQVILEGVGAVFSFPCYWISVPKELSYEYITRIIKAFYEEHVETWLSSSNSGNTNIGGSTSSNNNCNCCPPCGIV